jgi:hypothetical protein
MNGYFFNGKSSILELFFWGGQFGIILRIDKIK